MDYSKFDVFLCHNSKEKEQVEQIREELKVRQIYAFLDKHDFEPFRQWMPQLEEVMPQIQAAAIFLGPSGIGPWHNMEMMGFLQEFARRKIRMGLVILPGCPDSLIQEIPLFLKGFHHVDFRQTDPNPMNQLMWGITGKRLDDRANDLVLITLSGQAEDIKVDNLEQLESLLSAQKWREADEQTKQVILKDSDGKPLTVPQIRELSLDVLDRIDRLWMEASGGKFGLRIQAQLWKKVLEPEKPKFNLFSKNKKVEPLTNTEAWNRFGYLLGWRNDDGNFIIDVKLNFSINSPPGFLPRTRLWLGGGMASVKQFVALMERVGQLDENR